MLKNYPYKITVVFFIILTGCASTQSRNSTTGEKSSWGDNFRRNMENAGTQIGFIDRKGIEDQQDSAKCEYATEAHKHLVIMKEKADQTTTGDILASTVNNYWALIPIPGSQFIHLFANDHQNSLGLWNKEGCWTKGCLDNKLQITADAINSYCTEPELELEPKLEPESEQVL